MSSASAPDRTPDRPSHRDAPASARALWQIGPGRAALRDTPIAAVAGDLLIAAHFSGISRGTEALVLAGQVPVSEHGRMRAPLQEGAFPFPVKYGYAAVGRILSGGSAAPATGTAASLSGAGDSTDPAALPADGTPVFVLGPHQAVFAAPSAMVHPLPEGLPPGRAVLAANMETALNILWDSGAGAGDRVAVVGAGVVGALVAYLCALLPGAEVTLIDTNPDRAALAAALGCVFAAPAAAPEGCDVVIHASASAAGLATALAAAGPEACVVEASWHGDRAVPAPLGAAFHSQRLRLISSQVGRLPPARAPRWSHARRLRKALELLRDPALDVLISGETEFPDLPEAYPRILADPATLCHRVRYP